MAVGKNITSKKGKEKQYHLPYIIEAVWKNIEWGKGEGDGYFGEENQGLKKWWGRLSIFRELHISLQTSLRSLE